MGPGRGSAGDLPIYKDPVFFVNLFYQPLQQGSQLLFCYREFNFQKSGAVKKTVDVIVKGKDHIVYRIGGIVDPVAKITGAVTHGYHHIIYFTNCSVVIAKRLHHLLLSLKSASRRKFVIYFFHEK
jgi:hypothetical protein